MSQQQTISIWKDSEKQLKRRARGDPRLRENRLLRITEIDGFKVLISFIADSGFLASSYSLVATNVVMPCIYYVYPQCHRLGRSAGEAIDEVTLIGTALGMLVAGWLADQSGRKKWYAVLLVILLVGTMGFVQASEAFMVPDANGNYISSMDIYAWITWWRFVIGIAIGAEYPLSAIITAESASTGSRGMMLAMVFSMQSFGRFLACAFCLAAVRVTAADWQLGSQEMDDKAKLAIDQAWRWAVGIGMIPAAIAILLRHTMPETPRFFYLRYNSEERLNLQDEAQTAPQDQEDGAAPGPLAQAQQLAQPSAVRFAWFKSAHNYLHGEQRGWVALTQISVLWAFLDITWYGLDLDQTSVLSTLAQDQVNNSTTLNFQRSLSADPLSGTVYNSTCSDALAWKSDTWSSISISDMLNEDYLRTIVIVSVASICGSLITIFAIHRIRRKHLLFATFLALALFFLIAGATLVGQPNQGHIASTVFYAMLHFTFNLGPNTLIFMLAAEVFPTVFRGTFFGISAASGKLGAIIIRAIIGATTSAAFPLGVRFLFFMPLMLVSACITCFLPEVEEDDTVGDGLFSRKIPKTLEAIAANPVDPDYPNQVPTIPGWENS